MAVVVSINQIEMGIAKYLDAELLPQLPKEGAKGFGVQVMATLATKRIGNLVRSYAELPLLKTMGIVDAQGGIDLPGLREAALQSMPDTGVSIDVPLAGKLTFYKADIDKLYKYICE